MGKHEFLDTLAIRMGSIYGEQLKFFNRNQAGTPIEELTRSCTIVAPGADGLEVDREGEYEAKFRREGIETPVRFLCLRWVGSTAPTLIFHHGSGDTPYHTRIRKILPAKWIPDRVNVIATDSPFNRTRREYFAAISDAQMFGELLAGSVVLIQALVTSLKATGCPRVVVSGISLGGWIANMHFAFFDTADEYRPVFAGAALDSLFTDSVYRSMVSAEALSGAVSLASLFNFESAFTSRDAGKVHALLARFDQYIVFDRQRAVYRPENIAVIEKGHVTGTMDNAAIREFLLTD